MPYDFPYIVNICYVINKQGQVLLQKKAKGFGIGKWNGPGGKIKADESIEESVVREVKEETDLNIRNIEKIAELEIVFLDNPEINNFAHVYMAKEFTGTPKDTGEGELKWFNIDKMPLGDMWEDDRYWLKNALSGEFQSLRFLFKNNKLTSYEKI